MRSVVLAAVWCAATCLHAAPTDVFDKAPPHIDNMLRERVTKFFQSHVDGKFRAAEEVIAEDSKDFYFAMEKKRYLSFEIVKIGYSENFSKATVVTAVEVEWRSPRLGVMRVKPPMTSMWKMDGGQWFWYVVPQKDWDTPWGKMNPGPDNPSSPMAQLFRGVQPQEVLDKVRVNKTDIKLSSYEKSSESVEISNSLPGEVTLRLEKSDIPGLQVKLNRDRLASGETATLNFEYAPLTTDAKARTSIRVMVNPTGQVFSFNLTFAIQPELEKQLPKLK